MHLEREARDVYMGKSDPSAKHHRDHEAHKFHPKFEQPLRVILPSALISSPILHDSAWQNQNGERT